ncbi:Catabolite control protein [Haploplasma axanthum]|uniref:Catabolite control protein n=2 Tax=Haploplasma axanthum TaxID=29552 RepID=A0A449BFJ1_HAPAX|nr:Catabolite control protein [Haploplasma axanthum]
MATIKDVAKKAGVSISTASYALNNQPNVHSKTREKILAAAKELNYYPNASARNLKTKRTGNIGFFIYGFDGPIFGDILEGVNNELQKKGFNIIVSSGESSAVILRERQVDAAIVFDSNLTDDTLLNYSEKYPVIVLDRDLKGKNIYKSQVDNKKAVERFISEMVDKGYKKIAYLSGPKDSPSNLERYKGFCNALNEKGIKEFKHYEGDFTIGCGYELGKRIAQETEKPEFIYCANDESAVGVLQAFRELNVRIPDEISVAGFDGIMLGEYTIPNLTTIAIDYKDWGHNLAHFITVLLNENEVLEIKGPEAKVKFKESTKWKNY